MVRTRQQTKREALQRLALLPSSPSSSSSPSPLQQPSTASRIAHLKCWIWFYRLLIVYLLFVLLLINSRWLFSNRSSSSSPPSFSTSNSYKTIEAFKPRPSWFLPRPLDSLLKQRPGIHVFEMLQLSEQDITEYMIPLNENHALTFYYHQWSPTAKRNPNQFLLTVLQQNCRIRVVTTTLNIAVIDDIEKKVYSGGSSSSSNSIITLPALEGPTLIWSRFQDVYLLEAPVVRTTPTSTNANTVVPCNTTTLMTQTMALPAPNFIYPQQWSGELHVLNLNETTTVLSIDLDNDTTTATTTINNDNSTWLMCGIIQTKYHLAVAFEIGLVSSYGSSNTKTNTFMTTVVLGIPGSSTALRLVDKPTLRLHKTSNVDWCLLVHRYHYWNPNNLFSYFFSSREILNITITPRPLKTREGGYY